MSKPHLPRRRFLAIAASAAVLACSGAARAAAPLSVRWRGRALGAEAEITLEHPDAAAAQSALADCVSELERLEAVFSLYRPDSALARLNAAGVLEQPPPDLVGALAEAARISEASGGAFDATVQVLWQAHARSLSATGKPPSATVLVAARELVDWRRVEVSPDRIALGRPGMAVTLNGLAQGHISDRVADLLRRRGFSAALVDMGEIVALGPHADGTPWQVAVRDPVMRARTLRRLPLAGGGLATTEAQGSSFAPGGAFGHLLDPATGRPALMVPSVTVRAPSATLADGLSTAIAVAGPNRAADILSRFPQTSALIQGAAGQLIEL